MTTFPRLLGALLACAVLPACSSPSSQPDAAPSDAALDSDTSDAATHDAGDANPTDADAAATDAGDAGGTPVTVTTARGAVVGRDFDTSAAFLGIPYAAPPTGPLRWRPPVEHDAWTQPLDASAVGPACPQPTDPLLHQPGIPTSEDCLSLNVWTPAVAPSAPAAVMVFVHGGSLINGSGGMALYDGRRLAERGRVVVVTLNYRLGALGFLAHPALSAEDPARPVSGNYGLLDQQLALRWVRANIAAFGGDPARVTLFGESAGSISVCANIASPLAAGLFQRAIGESGSCQGITTPLHDVAGGVAPSAEALGLAYATTLGCDTAADPLACMRGKSAADVLAAAQPAYNFTIDGYALPERPWDAFRAGRVNPVPLLDGVNRDEATLFTFQNPVHNEAEYEAAVRATVGDAHVAEVTTTLYPAPSAAYATVDDAYNAFLTDLLALCPARAQTRFVSAPPGRAAQPAYLYLFTHETSLGRTLGLGVFHASELPYVFGNFVAPFQIASGDQPVSDAMMGYWTRFATTGDPNGAGATEWPVFTPASDAYLEIGDATHAGTGLHASQCAVLDTWVQ